MEMEDCPDYTEDEDYHLLLEEVSHIYVYIVCFSMVLAIPHTCMLLSGAVGMY